MADQLGLFGEVTPLEHLGPRDVGRGARGGSVEAAKVPDRPEKYIEILRALNRFTHSDQELANVLPHVNHGTISKRRLRLERAGLCEVVPEVTRRTRDGVEAMVFRITKPGQEVLTQWAQEHETSSGKSHLPGREATSTSSMPSGPLPESGQSSNGT